MREIDALDGIMGRAIDKAGIHFRILNSSKGYAVHSPRAQADRKLYKIAVREILENYPNLTILYNSVEDLIIDNDKIKGVILASGEAVYAESVVLTTGTFYAELFILAKSKLRREGLAKKLLTAFQIVCKNINLISDA